METPDLNRKLHVYGCSFSDGGGLDAREYFTSGLKKGLIPSDWVSRVEDFLTDSTDYSFDEFKNNHRYSDIISRKLNIDTFNYSTTANNNENIYNVAYEHIVKYPNCIHIIQWSIPERKMIWIDRIRKFINLQGITGDWTGQITKLDKFGGINKFKDMNVSIFSTSRDSSFEDIDYSKEQENYIYWLLNNFNLDYEFNQITKLTRLLDTFAKANNIPLYWIPWDYRGPFLDSFIDLDQKDLQTWSIDNSLQIKHETEGEYDDSHLSLKGNYVLAEKIIEKFKEDSLL